MLWVDLYVFLFSVYICVDQTLDDLFDVLTALRWLFVMGPGRL